MKTKFTFSVLVAFCLLFLGFTTPESGDKAPVSSLLWKIEGKGLQKASYLFGTMHLIQKQYYYFPESLEKIIRKSDLIVTEIDLDELNNQAKAMELMTLKEGSLFDYFTTSQEDSLIDWMKDNLKIDSAAFYAGFDKFKPLVLMQTILQMKFIGKTESYEGTIGKLAAKHKIETLGVEGIEDQIALFDMLSKEDQAEMVMETLRDGEKQIKTMNELQAIYKRQNVDSIYWFMQQEGGSIAREQKLFLDNRNQNWIPKIEEFMKGKTAFIAVGAGHLGGENGVINLLRQQGYTLTPVKF